MENHKKNHFSGAKKKCNHIFIEFNIDKAHFGLNILHFDKNYQKKYFYLPKKYPA